MNDNAERIKQYLEQLTNTNVVNRPFCILDIRSLPNWNVMGYKDVKDMHEHYMELCQKLGWTEKVKPVVKPVVEPVVKPVVEPVVKPKKKKVEPDHKPKRPEYTIHFIKFATITPAVTFTITRGTLSVDIQKIYKEIAYNCESALKMIKHRRISNDIYKSRIMRILLNTSSLNFLRKEGESDFDLFFDRCIFTMLRILNWAAIIMACVVDANNAYSTAIFEYYDRYFGATAQKFLGFEEYAEIVATQDIQALTILEKYINKFNDLLALLVIARMQNIDPDAFIEQHVDPVVHLINPGVKNPFGIDEYPHGDHSQIHDRYEILHKWLSKLLHALDSHRYDIYDDRSWMIEIVEQYCNKYAENDEQESESSFMPALSDNTTSESELDRRAQKSIAAVATFLDELPFNMTGEPSTSVKKFKTPTRKKKEALNALFMVGSPR